LKVVESNKEGQMGHEAPASSLFQRLKNTKRLPSPPGTAMQVLELCRREDVDVQQIADIVMSDSVLAGRMLKFANSPMAGISRQVTSVREALLLLGLRTVKLTALGFSLAMPAQEARCPAFKLKHFWAGSWLRAVIARRLVVAVGNGDREEAFTAALLSGLGQLALAHGFGDEYSRVLEEVKKGKALAQAESEILGSDHYQVGALLMKDWGLPDILVQAVALQSGSAWSETRATPAGELAWIIGTSRRLLPTFAEARDGIVELKDSDRALVEQTLKLNEEAWQQMSRGVLKDYQDMAGLFEMELEDAGVALELCAEAQEQATRVGLVAQLERTKAVQDNMTLKRLATTDPLTGVANRAKFDERMKQEIAGVQRNHGHFALLMLDIDHFKTFNDSHGHQAGDLVLKRVATAIGNTMREVDLVARYGGEEFAVLMPHTDRRGACIVAARTQRCVQELELDLDGGRITVTISSGLAVTSDYPQAPTAEQLVADADAQLYLSKGAGRNTWSYLGRSASRLRSATAPARVPCGK
jgi:diguanylate cyclase (GGDEF)-like protein